MPEHFLKVWIVVFSLFGTADGNIPTPSPPDLLATTFSGTIVYEGDPVEGPDADRSFDVWVIGAPDWKPRLVTGASGFEGHPAWSPDGRRIVFASHNRNESTLFTIKPDGSDRQRLGAGDYPNWLDEGIAVRKTSGWKLWNLKDSKFLPYDRIPTEVQKFSISPDRSRIIFVRKMKDLSWQIFLRDSNDENERQLTHGSPRAIHPVWSPDGKRIAYSVGDGRRNGQWEVHVLDVRTGESRAITRNLGPDWACDWSPDGRWVLVASAYEENWDIYAVRSDGTERVRITSHLGDVRYGSWTATEHLRQVTENQD